MTLASAVFWITLAIFAASFYIVRAIKRGDRPPPKTWKDFQRKRKKR